jgi:outer membrane protein
MSQRPEPQDFDTMRVRLVLGWVLILSLVAAIGYAQTPAPTPALSLAEAITIARRNNPDYRQVLNNRTPAGRSLTSATANLFTPRFGVSADYYWTDAGTRFIQGLKYSSPVGSTLAGGIGFSYSLSGATISNRGLAAAELRATDEDIANALTVLETSVRTQYLAVLEAQAQAAVAHRALERAREQFNLAQARYTVGQGTLIDVRRAEVDTGTAAVGLLRADQATQNAVLALYQRLGVPATSLDLALTDSFPVVVPPWRMDSLVTYALAENPLLRSLRARESSARWSTRAARSEYLPSLNLQAGTGRTRAYKAPYDQVIDSAGNTVQIPSETSYFTNPWSFAVSLSLPIYDGFSRYTRTAQAQAQEDDLRQQVRARELGVRADVVAAFYALQAAYQAVGLQAANRGAAAEALELATQRYRVGSGSFLEQLDARLAADRADADYTSAVYAYHRSIAALEQAVGRPLR